MSEELRRAPRLKPGGKWVPKKWIPLYDQMVALHCVGLSNKAISERFDYSAQQVGNILKTEQAKIIIELVRKKTLGDLEESTAARLKRMEHQAISNIERIISDEALVEARPLALFDRSMALLKGIGKMEGENSIRSVQNNTFNIAIEHSQALIEGMKKANEAAILHKGNVEVRTLPPGDKDAGRS